MFFIYIIRFIFPFAPTKCVFRFVQAPETAWQHDMFSDKGVAFQGQAGRASAIETGTKLLISNLDYGVSNDDIKVFKMKNVFCYFLM